MTYSGEYLVAKTLNERMRVIHEFIESDTYTYLLIIDWNRCADLLPHIKNGVYPVRVVIDIDNNEEIIAYESKNIYAITKSIYVRSNMDEDAIGIIEHCIPLIAIF